MDSGQGGPDHHKHRGKFNSPTNHLHNNYNEERDNNGMRLWGVIIFGLIGATFTTYAVGHARRTIQWFYSEVNRATRGASGSQQRNHTGEEAWNRYQRQRKSWNEYQQHKQKCQEEYEEEMERVERIRRMQGVFNRERYKYKRSYEQWHENPSDAYQQQNFQRDDWYWNTDKSYQDRKENERKARMRASGNYTLSHHYEVLGLDTSRAEPYSEAEIKVAFRTKAKEYHPDQNITNKEAAEEKFKEVMISYEALKMEMKTK